MPRLDPPLVPLAVLRAAGVAGATAVPKSRVGVSLAVIAAVAACAPTLSIPEDAQLTCAHDVDCPAGSLCSSGGFCLDGGPCVIQGTADAVADGTACGDDDRICVGGACVAPFCGDGVVQLGDGEECDPRRDPRCRADCTLPRCGDGVVDAFLGETCDENVATCVDCTFMCAGVVAGSPATLSATGDCDLDDSDGCDCVPAQRDIEDASERIFFQAAVRGDTVYLVSANRALNAAQLRFRLERVDVAGGGIARTAVFDDEPFLDLAEPEDEGDDELFYLRASTTHNELHRVDASGADTVLRSAQSSADAVGRIAVDADAVWGAGLDGLRRVSRADGSLTSVDVDVCHDGRVARLVSCGGVVACFDAIDGDVSAVDKDTHEVTTLFHVDVVTAPAGGALNDQVLFCRDGALLLDDRVALWSFDGAGGRSLIALLPKLDTTAHIEVARSFARGALVAGVVPRTAQQVTVFVDLASRASTVLMPGSFLARHGRRVVAADGFTGSLVFLDVDDAAFAAPGGPR